MNGILIDQATGDIDVTSGTVVIGDTTLQEAEQIIISYRGEYKEYPLIGGEVQKMQHGNISRFWPNRVKNMCKAMGQSVKDFRISSDGKIILSV